MFWHPNFCAIAPVFSISHRDWTPQLFQEPITILAASLALCLITANVCISAYIDQETADRSLDLFLGGPLLAYEIVDVFFSNFVHIHIEAIFA